MTYHRAVFMLPLLLTSVYTAQIPDRQIGVAVFKCVKTTDAGKHVYLEPLITPTLTAVRLSGDKTLDTTITQCSVSARFLSSDDKDKATLTVTVLRCGGQEYGVDGIQFAMAEK